VWIDPPEGLDPDDGKPSADRIHMIAVHPKFSENRFVYFSYIKWGAQGHTLAVARGVLNGDALQGVRDIFVAEAWTKGKIADATSAGRLFFAPDGKLFVTVGDRDVLFGTDDNTLRMRAQDLKSDAGKIVRITDVGSVPDDNPFQGRPEARPEIYTYGHRNAYGLAVNPVTNDLWEVEIGPFGGDELNLLIPGHNYGWPLVSLGKNYTGNLVSEQPWWRPGMDMPEMFWSPVISPSSMIFYDGDKFPAWKGNLLVGALTTKEIKRITFTAKGRPGRAQESLLSEMGSRIRDLVQGPDGFLYLATETRINDSSDRGTVLRVEPAK
jgi:glucose/arabinose dehydrogenase